MSWLFAVDLYRGAMYAASPVAWLFDAPVELPVLSGARKRSPGYTVRARFTGEAMRVIAPGSHALYLDANGTWRESAPVRCFDNRADAERAAQAQWTRYRHIGRTLVTIEVIEWED